MIIYDIIKVMWDNPGALLTVPSVATGKWVLHGVP